MILAGDVGGTNARLALVRPNGRSFEFLWRKTWPSREHRSLEEIVAAARREIGAPIAAASFGIAGPVVDERVHATNLAWTVDARDLARVLELPSVGLLNDLEAHALALPTLGDEDIAILQEGAPDAHGNQALIAAGTGLGEAGLYWNGREHAAFACEGGHTSFAPASDLEFDLCRHLAKRFGHVSFERILSGPGLVNVYTFLAEIERGREPAKFAEEVARDGAAAITRAALDGSNERASLALDLFCDVYGAEAGNLALKIMATGGMWIGGGIGPRIQPLLRRRFVRTFVEKGRMKPLLEAIPVRLVLNDKTALIGAARHAAARLAHP